MRAAIRPAPSLPRFHPAAWAALLLCATPTVWAKAPGVTPPPRKKPAAPTNNDPLTSPAPSKNPNQSTPAPSPKPEVPPVPLVSADGPLSRNDLIQLAIQAHPDFWRFRGEVAYYLQAEAAAYDWRDPELRIGFDHEFEQDLSRPYEERRSINTTEQGIFDNTSTTGFSRNNGSTEPGAAFTGTTFERESVSQSRKITTETVEKITPGKYQDVIEKTTYEVERRNESSRQNQLRRDNIPSALDETENSRTSEYSRRRVLARSKEYRTHPNDLYGDEQFSVQARLFIPNPWEMKARAALARAEADLSTRRLQSEVRKLVFDVGRRYDEMQFRYAWHQANLRLAELQIENFKAVEEEAKRNAESAIAAGIGNLYNPEEVPRARLEISQAREEVFDSGRELALVKEELGLLCGINDPSRIQMTNALRLRKVSETQLDQAALLELARAHRPDLGEMKARSDVERARLREIKALRLPWINDLRVGWSQTSTDGYRDQDELTAMLSLNLPLFSWWQNKSHRQHEEAIANFEEAQTVLGERIDHQVNFAVRAVREAAASLAEFSRSADLLREDLRKNEIDATAAGDKGARIRLASKEALIKSSRGRLQALYHYNQAVAHLELALGLPIEEAFASPAAKAPGAK